MFPHGLTAGATTGKTEEVREAVPAISMEKYKEAGAAAGPAERNAAKLQKVWIPPGVLLPVSAGKPFPARALEPDSVVKIVLFFPDQISS
nr:hypothetical protein [uncultured Acetatifactor sp.]